MSSIGSSTFPSGREFTEESMSDR